MKPLPADERNPLAEDINSNTTFDSIDELILWLIFKEAKGTIPFGSAAAPAAPEGE